MQEPFELTKRRDGRTQITCKCDGYAFPHRLGSPDCWYHQNADLCWACDTGECELHMTHEGVRHEIPSETLSAAERNRGMRQHLASGKGGWL